VETTATSFPSTNVATEQTALLLKSHVIAPTMVLSAIAPMKISFACLMTALSNVQNCQTKNAGKILNVSSETSIVIVPMMTPTAFASDAYRQRM